MVIEGRSIATPAYRYGFNGMEKNDEINTQGNSYDFGARIFDARLGRWLSVDPLEYKYPNISPYVFALNNPIVLIDPNGEEVGKAKAYSEKKNYIASFELWSAQKCAKELLARFEVGKLKNQLLYFSEAKNEEPGLTTFGVLVMENGVEVFKSLDGKFLEKNAKYVTKDARFKIDVAIDPINGGDGAAILNHEAFLWAKDLADQVEQLTSGETDVKSFLGKIKSLSDGIDDKYKDVNNPKSDLNIAQDQLIQILTERISAAQSSGNKEALEKVTKESKSAKSTIDADKSVNN